jgi:hypothetical protein
MPIFSAQKVVSALPQTLNPSTLYFVRKNEGFDLYLTNETGTLIAYPINVSASGNIDGGVPSSASVSNIEGGTP